MQVGGVAIGAGDEQLSLFGGCEEPGPGQPGLKGLELVRCPIVPLPLGGRVRVGHFETICELAHSL